MASNSASEKRSNFLEDSIPPKPVRDDYPLHLTATSTPTITCSYMTIFVRFFPSSSHDSLINLANRDRLELYDKCSLVLAQMQSLSPPRSDFGANCTPSLLIGEIEMWQSTSGIPFQSSESHIPSPTLLYPTPQPCPTPIRREVIPISPSSDSVESDSE